MKIYFIGQKGVPAKFGGVEKHVEELATRLVKAGHEIYVYTRPHYTDAKLKNYKGVNLISLPTITTKHLDAITHTFLACLHVIKQNPDLIHFHSIGPSSLIWLVKLLKPSIPIVATFHTKCYEHKKWRLPARLYLKFGEIITCLLADKTIAVSKTLAKYVQNKYGVIAYYIPSGVKLPKIFKPSKIKRWGLTKQNYILAVSRLVKHKGIHYLFEAFKKIKTNKKLVIAGASAYTNNYVRELKGIARNNTNIIFTGNQTGEILAELFSNAYLFVQPSESEGLSIALLEAMSYQKAVLVSNILENKEVIRNTGFIFKNKSVKSLQKKLSYLLKQPLLVGSRGRLAQKRVKLFYNWGSVTKNTIELYRNVVAEKGNLKFSRLKFAKRFIGFLL